MRHPPLLSPAPAPLLRHPSSDASTTAGAYVSADAGTDTSTHACDYALTAADAYTSTDTRTSADAKPDTNASAYTCIRPAVE